VGHIGAAGEFVCIKAALIEVFSDHLGPDVDHRDAWSMRGKPVGRKPRGVAIEGLGEGIQYGGGESLDPAAFDVLKLGVANPGDGGDVLEAHAKLTAAALDLVWI